MKCPICKKEIQKADPEFPFCSERCRVIDLGNWAMEKYRVPGPPIDQPRLSGDDAGGDDD